MKVTIVPIVIGAFDTVTKGLLKGLEDLKVGVETIQTTAFLKMARILRRILETWGDLLSLNLQWKLSAYADVKNSKRIYNNNNKNCLWLHFIFVIVISFIASFSCPFYLEDFHNIWNDIKSSQVSRTLLSTLECICYPNTVKETQNIWAKFLLGKDH